MAVNFWLASWHNLAVIGFFAISALGCAPATSQENQQLAVEELAYIDFKRGFSLVTPITWQRQKIPVARPDYRADTVHWLIPGSQGPDSSLLIRKIAVPPTSLQDKLAAFLRTQTALNSSTGTAAEHPAGPALRLDGQDGAERVIYLIIGKPEQAYLIAFKISAGNYVEQLPKLEKVALSFSILP